MHACAYKFQLEHLVHSPKTPQPLWVRKKEEGKGEWKGKTVATDAGTIPLEG